MLHGSRPATRAAPYRVPVPETLGSPGAPHPRRGRPPDLVAYAICWAVDHLPLVRGRREPRPAGLASPAASGPRRLLGVGGVRCPARVGALAQGRSKSGSSSWGAPPKTAWVPAWAGPGGFGALGSRTSRSLGRRTPGAPGWEPDGCFAKACAFLRVRGPPTKASAMAHGLCCSSAARRPRTLLSAEIAETSVRSEVRISCRATYHRPPTIVLDGIVRI